MTLNWLSQNWGQVHFVSAPQSGSSVKVETVVIKGKEVPFQVVPESAIRLSIDFYIRTDQEYRLESSPGLVKWQEVADPSFEITPTLEKRPGNCFKSSIQCRVHQKAEEPLPIVRLTYWTGPHWSSFGVPYVTMWGRSEGASPDDMAEVPHQKETRSPTILHELLRLDPEPMALIVPVFPRHTRGEEWARIQATTHSYNGFKFTQDSPDWNVILNHARGLVRSGAVIQLTLPDGIKSSVSAKIRLVTQDGRRIQIYRRLPNR